MTDAVVLHRFSYLYGSCSVLSDLSFSVPEGVRLSIVGPNGAGKSTLLRCMLGLPSGGKPRGEVRLFGRCPFRSPRTETARLAAHMPQASSGPLPFTVLDYVRLSRFPHESRLARSRGRDDEPVRTALDAVGMGRALHRRMEGLSGGETQKVMLAAALAQETPLLLLDEPAAFLDPRHAGETARILRRLHREGRTTVAVTHDLNRAMHESDRVLALKGGRVAFDGPPSAFAETSVIEDVFEARFLSTPHPTTGVPWIVPAEL